MSTLTHQFDLNGGRTSAFFVRKGESVDVTFENYVADTGTAGIKLQVSQIGEPAFDPVVVFSAAQLAAGDFTYSYENETGFDVMVRLSTGDGWDDAVDATIADVSELVDEYADQFNRPDGSPFLQVFDDHVEFPETPTVGGETVALTGALADFVTDAELTTALADYLLIANLQTELETLNVVFEGDVQTLTNKRITARTSTEVSSATPTINTDNVDYHSITALATDITSFTTNLSGTPVRGDSLFIEITAAGAQTIAWGASFEDGATALPVAINTETLFIALIWNAGSSKWRCVGVA